MKTNTVWSYLLILNTVVIVSTTPPPGYVKESNEDQHPPNYKYSYDIEHNKDGTSQGKQETREGELAHGRYYVSLPRRGASSQVQYFADDWGYHPFVQYSTTNAHSKVSAHFALGEHAVKALQSSNRQINNVATPLQIQNNAPKRIEFTDQNIAISSKPSSAQQYLIRPQSDSSILLPVIFQTYASNLPVYQAQTQGQFEIVPNQHQEKLRQLTIENNLQQIHAQNEQQNVQSNQANNVEIFINHNQGLTRINNEIQNEIYKSDFSGYGQRNINRSESDGYSTLVKNTQNLITGADVIDINSALEINTDDNLETNINLHQDQQSSNNFIYPQNEIYKNTTDLAQPIIVAEFSNIEDDTSSNSISTTQKYDHEEREDCDDNEDESTESTHSGTSPRPLSINFLAPITAALRIQNSGEKIENIITSDCDDKKAVETVTNNVEIQKSIPFYIGKFEFFDDLKGNLKPFHQNVDESENVPSKIEYQQVNGAAVNRYYKSQKDDPQDQESDHSIRNDQTIVQEELTVTNDFQQAHEKDIDQKLAEETVVTNSTQPIQIPVQIPIQIPIEITQIVEKPIENPVSISSIPTQPYSVQFGNYLGKSIAQPYIIPIPHSNPLPVTKLLTVPLPIKQFINPQIPIYYLNQFPKDSHMRQNIAPIYKTLSYNIPHKNSGVQIKNTKQNGQRSILKNICTEINKKFCDDYKGPTPPFSYISKARRNAQTDRTLFGKNLRIEYGFKPPMVPSVETDEFGNPLHKSDS